MVFDIIHAGRLRFGNIGKDIVFFSLYFFRLIGCIYIIACFAVHGADRPAIFVKLFDFHVAETVRKPALEHTVIGHIQPCAIRIASIRLICPLNNAQLALVIKPRFHLVVIDVGERHTEPIIILDGFAVWVGHALEHGAKNIAVIFIGDLIGDVVACVILYSDRISICVKALNGL